jgi:hypothetical protein
MHYLMEYSIRKEALCLLNFTDVAGQPILYLKAARLKPNQTLSWSDL